MTQEFFLQELWYQWWLFYPWRVIVYIQQ